MVYTPTRVYTAYTAYTAYTTYTAYTPTCSYTAYIRLHNYVLTLLHAHNILLHTPTYAYTLANTSDYT